MKMMTVMMTVLMMTVMRDRESNTNSSVEHLAERVLYTLGDGHFVACRSVVKLYSRMWRTSSSSSSSSSSPSSSSPSSHRDHRQDYDGDEEDEDDDGGDGNFARRGSPHRSRHKAID